MFLQLTAVLAIVPLLLGCQAPGRAGAVDELAVELAGRHSRGEVEARLEEAMLRYGVPTNEEGYRMAVDLLRQVRRGTLAEECDECDEMLILEHMLLLPADGRLSFEQAARAATTIILHERLFRERSLWPSESVA